MKESISVTEAAKLLGISRTAVIKAIQTGRIKAQKIGHMYVIQRSNLSIPSDATISNTQKRFIESSVDRVVKEYGETLKMLKDA